MRTITVGRDNSCDIVINDSRVSRILANIFRNGDGYTYRDMSTNGTRINGVLVQRTDIFFNPVDSVLLVSSVPLPWEKVKILFPEETLLNISNKGKFNNNGGLMQASEKNQIILKNGIGELFVLGGFGRLVMVFIGHLLLLFHF